LVEDDDEDEDEDEDEGEDEDEPPLPSAPPFFFFFKFSVKAMKATCCPQSVSGWNFGHVLTSQAQTWHLGVHSTSVEPHDPGRAHCGDIRSWAHFENGCSEHSPAYRHT